MNSAHEHIIRAVIEKWPEHEPFLRRMTTGCDARLLSTTEQVAELILKLAQNNLGRLIDGYCWMCQMFLEEELEFLRSGHCRYSRYDEVKDRVYGDSVLMMSYMDGLLLSQVLWLNHIRVLNFYIQRFLPLLTGKSHLEIGPGHGLLLYLASHVGVCITGWDVSGASLSMTQDALDTLGIMQPVKLEQRSVYDPTSAIFESVVISEVLEHIENPREALKSLHAILAPGGVIYVNSPVNSPAIDHIYCFRSPEELVNLVQDVGFEIEDSCFAPVTGYTEARARKLNVAISCAVIGRKIS